MTFSAAKWAKGFAATYAVKLSDRQHKAFVDALTRALNDAYSEGYRKGYAAAEYDDTK